MKNPNWTSFCLFFRLKPSALCASTPFQVIAKTYSFVFVHVDHRLRYTPRYRSSVDHRLRYTPRYRSSVDHRLRYMTRYRSSVDHRLRCTPRYRSSVDHRLRYMPRYRSSVDHRLRYMTRYRSSVDHRLRYMTRYRSSVDHRLGYMTRCRSSVDHRLGYMTRYRSSVDHRLGYMTRCRSSVDHRLGYMTRYRSSVTTRLTEVQVNSWTDWRHPERTQDKTSVPNLSALKLRQIKTLIQLCCELTATPQIALLSTLYSKKFLFIQHFGAWPSPGAWLFLMVPDGSWWFPMVIDRNVGRIKEFWVKSKKQCNLRGGC